MTRQCNQPNPSSGGKHGAVDLAIFLHISRLVTSDLRVQGWSPVRRFSLLTFQLSRAPRRHDRMRQEARRL